MVVSSLHGISQAGSTNDHPHVPLVCWEFLFLNDGVEQGPWNNKTIIQGLDQNMEELPNPLRRHCSRSKTSSAEYYTENSSKSTDLMAHAEVLLLSEREFLLRAVEHIFQNYSEIPELKRKGMRSMDPHEVMISLHCYKTFSSDSPGFPYPPRDDNKACFFSPLVLMDAHHVRLHFYELSTKSQLLPYPHGSLITDLIYYLVHESYRGGDILFTRGFLC